MSPKVHSLHLDRTKVFTKGVNIKMISKEYDWALVAGASGESRA